MLLQWVDIGIIAIIGLSVLTGLFRGFVKELVALGVWILAIYLGYHYSSILDPWLQKYIQDASARKIVGFVVILFAVLIAGGIVNAIFGFILKRSGLSGTDRVLGMCFGLVRGLFIIAIIMIAVKMTSLPYEDYAKNSVLYSKFDPLVDWLSQYMPDFIKKVKSVDKTEGLIDTIPFF